MNKLEDIGRELERRRKADAIRSIADSEDGQLISRMFDAKAVERAAKSGDTKALKDILTQVLGTSEGQRLLENVKNAMNGK